MSSKLDVLAASLSSSESESLDESESESELELELEESASTSRGADLVALVSSSSLSDESDESASLATSPLVSLAAAALTFVSPSYSHLFDGPADSQGVGTTSEPCLLQ